MRFFRKALIKRTKQRPTLQTFLLRFLIIFVLLACLVYAISIRLDPNAFKTLLSQIYLVPAVLSGISILLALFIPIFIEIFKEKLLFWSSEKILERETNSAYRSLGPKMYGLHKVIQREETNFILRRISEHNAILLSGSAGLGKSAVGIALVDEFRKMNYFPVLFDARRFERVNTIGELSNYLDLQENIMEVITRYGTQKSCILVLDQLDSTCESQLGETLVDLAIECIKVNGVSVVVISRHTDIEKNLLRPLLEAGFEEVPCNELNDETVRTILEEHGLDNPPENVILSGKNILMLDLICSIFEEEGPDVLDQLVDNLSIWDKYIDLYLDGERRSTGISKPEILGQLVLLALNGLRSEDRSFILNDPPSNLHKRFISQGLISQINKKGRRFVFKVENFQDYLYARDATQREISKEQVEQEIYPFYLRNVLLRMTDFYQRDGSPLYETFLSEVLSG